MFVATTRDIKVVARAYYLEDHSAPEDDHFVWAYRIRIENWGEETVQLLNRYWQITDARGHVHEVRGAGVVGEQPVLEPGSAFEYTSGTPLKTPSGIMLGSYQMETADGKVFDVAIPAFSLDSPQQPTNLH